MDVSAPGREALRQILECLSEGVVIVDGDGRSVLSNRAAVELLGIALTNEVSEQWSELFGLFRPDTVTPFPAQELPLVRALRGEESHDVAMYVKNGVVPCGRHLSVTARPLLLADGSPRGAVVAFHDTGTTMRVDDEELRKHRWFLESIVEQVPLMIFVKEARELRFERFNRAGEVLLGMKRDEMIGKNDHDFFPKDQADFFTSRDRETLRLGEIVDIAEEPISTASGERWLHTRKVPILDEEGQPKYLLGISEDISERRAAAEALHRANEQLEQRVRERTAELERANEILREQMAERQKAEGALREADRQKNRFLAMLSHELRNPLAPIRNGLYILERSTPDSDQAHRAHAVIDRQVAHMARLVDDLLDISRIEHGKVQLQRTRLDLDELMVRTVEDLRTIFVDSGVQLEVHSAGPAVWVNGDATRLAQAIGNLLTNAAKFTARGGKATVSLRADAPRKEAVLSVTNTGSGIDSQVFPRLFEPFAQGETTLDRSKGGLGLGLALVKKFVEMHGGAVRAASEGTGATFTLTLPLDGKSAAAVTSRSVEKPTVRKVLVIEDNADAADTLRDALELGGHVVEVAHDGPMGIARARVFAPDVVLCDIGLPGMDGYDVARTMRADADLCDIALVALSGYAQSDDVSRATAAGFDAHLAKPSSMEVLESKVATVIDAARNRH